MIGPVGGKLHTGRSRNDQVAMDMRLWMLDATKTLKQNICDLVNVMVNRAERWVCDLINVMVNRVERWVCDLVNVVVNRAERWVCDLID